MAAGNNFGFSTEEIYRYSRQLLLPEIGFEGQSKLKQSAVLLVGAGGLGSVQALYLAAAGVGRIGIIDGDEIEISNLQRQIIFRNRDSGKKKVEIASKELQALNPDIIIAGYDDNLTSENAADIVTEYDILLDGSDNFATRYLVNDVCVMQQKPVIYGSVYRFDGQVMVFDARKGPCYRCLYPAPPPPDTVPSCVIGGVLGVVPGFTGIVQATQVIKMICNLGRISYETLLLIDTLEMTVEKIKVVKNPDCPICGKNPVIKKLIDYERYCGELEPDLPESWTVTPRVLHQQLKSGVDITLLDVRGGREAEICVIPGAKVIGMKDIESKLSNYADGSNIIIYCRSGIRSGRAVHLLRSRGFNNIRHLSGGILAWIKEVDPSMPLY